MDLYDVFSTAPLDATGTITFVCTKNDKNIRVTLDRGSSSSFNRRLQSGAEQLGYNLYLDQAYSAVWGDGSSGTQVYQNRKPGKNNSINIPVYGRIPAGQDAAAGTYSDNVVLTVLW